ncbi:alpha/beta hydrolase [Leisingera sp. JC11]|uniref:alpha/beta hydrolase n=1 Tax=Leisingera sp. JC11 TaxID=3042469 RepID=UPI003455CDFF
MDGAPVELQPAPLFAEIAQGPAGGAAHWAHTSDGLRIRAGHWHPDGEAKGTVLLFPGRTEYIEKYGLAAAEFAARGYATLTVDWRGQGLSDRMLAERRLGHVGHFTDFQKDVKALTSLAAQLKLPQPWHLVGHSMGGAIGLRALNEGLDVNACCFTGPMWGILIPPLMRPLANLLGSVAPYLRLEQKLLPTTALDQYVQITPFEGNTLTTDPEMYRMMHAQLAAQPDLVLGGPTIQWLRVSLQECAELAAMPSPALPCITFLGSDEQIVSPEAVHDRMARWPGGELDLIKGAQHEVMMEAPEIRAHVFSSMCRLFDQHSR